jgi:branched-chain amino acid transport system permease protein
MEALLLQVLSGLATGGIYASLALAVVMIYKATHVVNFAQGEMAMFSTYLAWQLIQWGLPYWGAFFLTIALSFVGGVLIERVIIRPFEAHDAVLAVVTVFIGLFLILNSLAGWTWEYTLKSFPSPFPAEAYLGGYLSGHQLGLFFVVLATLAVVYAFFRFTPLGLAMRAAAENPDSSRLVGIRVSWMLALGWGFAAALGAIAGIMVAPLVFLEPNMMGFVLIYAFAGALLGGIDNPWGAVIGGFAMGVLENIMGVYVVGTELKLTVALVIIVGVLVIRPSGIFGRAVVTRV